MSNKNLKGKILKIHRNKDATYICEFTRIEYQQYGVIVRMPDKRTGFSSHMFFPYAKFHHLTIEHVWERMEYSEDDNE